MKPLSLQKTKQKKQGTTSTRHKKIFFRKVTYISVAVAILIIAGLSWYGWRSGFFARTSESIEERYDDAVSKVSKSLGLTLKNIYVEGEVFTPTDTIIEVVGLEQGQPIMAISLKELKARLEKLEWIKEVYIERHIPSTLHVRITEKEPAAIWQHKKKLKLIDEKGNVISGRFVDRFSYLPIIVGEEANKHVEILFKMFNSEPDLKSTVTAAIWIGKRRWNIRFSNGIEIMLPEKDPEIAWKYLLKLNKEKKLLKRNIRYVDLRIPDKVFIKPVSQPATVEKVE